MSAQLSAPVPTTVSRTIPMKTPAVISADDELGDRRRDVTLLPRTRSRSVPTIEDDEVRDRDDRPEHQERGRGRRTARRAARRSNAWFPQAAISPSESRPGADEEHEQP